MHEVELANGASKVSQISWNEGLRGDEGSLRS